MNLRTIAIIPARGGSKRIPRKNIKEFAGKPMIAHSIGTALESGLFDRVIVSTDSDEIAEVARAWGAEVPFLRPAELANDITGTDAVLLHGIHASEKLYGPVSLACCIYATVPLLRAEYLHEGLKLLQQSGAASSFAVATFPYPIFRALRINERDQLQLQWPEYAETRSQDLPEVFLDAGQFYWVDAQQFKAIPCTLHNAVPVMLPRWAVQDIDTPEDWEVAENLFHALELRQWHPT